MILKDGKPASKNRSNLEIVHEVLSTALVKVCKTRIMYQANLSYIQLGRYLKALVGNSLLSFDGDAGYLTTNSGQEFLQLYEKYLEHSTRLKGEVEGHEKARLHLENMCGLGTDKPRK